MRLRAMQSGRGRSYPFLSFAVAVRRGESGVIFAVKYLL